MPLPLIAEELVKLWRVVVSIGIYLDYDSCYVHCMMNQQTFLRMSSLSEAQDGNLAQVAWALACFSKERALALSYGTAMELIVSTTTIDFLWWVQSSHWILPDLAASDMIKFGIESKFSCTKTSTKQFKEMIASALIEMQSVCQSFAIAGNTIQNSHTYGSL